MASDLCGGGPSPSPRMWQGGPRAQFEQVGESCTRWGRTGVHMRPGRTRTQRQKDHSKAEKVKTMKTRDQRRQRQPLGSVFVGQAPQKRSLAGAASCFLPNMVAPLAEKACQMGSKYTCQIWPCIHATSRRAFNVQGADVWQSLGGNVISGHD